MEGPSSGLCATTQTWLQLLSNGLLDQFFRDSHQKELKNDEEKYKAASSCDHPIARTGNRVRRCLWRHRTRKFCQIPSSISGRSADCINLRLWTSLRHVSSSFWWLSRKNWSSTLSPWIWSWMFGCSEILLQPVVALWIKAPPPEKIHLSKGSWYADFVTVRKGGRRSCIRLVMLQGEVAKNGFKSNSCYARREFAPHVNSTFLTWTSLHEPLFTVLFHKYLILKTPELRSIVCTSPVKSSR